MNQARRALFLQGGWEGHQPEKIVQKFGGALQTSGFDVEVATALERLADADWVRSFNVVCPCWTMGALKQDESEGLRGAVRAGVGLGGVHGGMGAAFRGDLDYEWMVGGHFAGHPHVGDYTVRVTEPADVIMQGVPAEFGYNSEQYYMMMDPAVRVLAVTDYTHEGRTCAMPVVWTKTWGRGRVFYSSLGHDPAEFDRHPHVMEMSLRGILWAAGAL
jgi:hypothetical protein